MSERIRWTIEYLPAGYPVKCKRRDLSDAVLDLSNELIDKSIKEGKDFINKGWKDRITIFIQLGQTELQCRNNNLVLAISIITLVVALFALFK